MCSKLTHSSSSQSDRRIVSRARGRTLSHSRNDSVGRTDVLDEAPPPAPSIARDRPLMDIDRSVPGLDRDSIDRSIDMFHIDRSNSHSIDRIPRDRSIARAPSSVAIARRRPSTARHRVEVRRSSRASRASSTSTRRVARRASIVDDVGVKSMTFRIDVVASTIDAVRCDRR